MARDQLSGSEAITNLRIRWIRFFAQLDSNARPTIVQLLARGDRLVSREDSLDVEQFSQARQYDVPGATHADLHLVPPDDTKGRYNILREAILGASPFGLRASEQTGTKRHPVVMVLHGIRANNEDWAAQIGDEIKIRAPNALAISPTYRYFSMLEFAIPWLRAKKIRWFQDQYSDLLARYPRASFSFIGHSNGTYMLAHSLKQVPGMVFDRITLVGSVLPREYDWNKLFTLGQVKQVTNHRSSFDVPVAILCNLLRALGMRDVGTAGFDGFDQRRPEIDEVYYYDGGHGKPLEKDNLKYLIEFTLSDKPDYPNALKDRAPGKFLSRLSGSAVVGLAVAVALLIVFFLAIWLLATLVGTFLTWQPAFAWAFAAFVVGVISYLLSRYY
jgi:predicted esterase